MISTVNLVNIHYHISEFVSLLPHSISSQKVRGPTQIQKECSSAWRYGSLGQKSIFGS